jgi:hypothetical protein
VQVAPVFVSQGGISIIVGEAFRDGVLASSQVFVCDILRLFARTHFSALFHAKIVHAIRSMLSFRTKRGADERQMDVDVKHAALMLLQLLHTEGDPLAVRFVHLPLPCLRAAA